jgi:hypothetical protein
MKALFQVAGWASHLLWRPQIDIPGTEFSVSQERRIPVRLVKRVLGLHTHTWLPDGLYMFSLFNFVLRAVCN